MRHCFFLMSVFFALNAFCQNNRKDEIALRAAYAQVQNKLYKIANAKESTSTLQSNTYQAIAAFIQLFPKAENCLYLIADAVNLRLQQYDSLVMLLDTSLKRSPQQSRAHYTRARIARAETGKLFPLINFTDTAGIKTSIEKYRGKVVLIDCWSSWCSPCRKQIPAFKKLYSKFKNKNFDIIGMSMDQDKKAWLKAIEKDDQTWNHYCELVPWDNNTFANRFYIFAIPSNFLLDKNGVILGQDLSPDQIEDLLTKQ